MKFKIVEVYTDLAFFRRVIKIEAKDEEEAERLFEEGEVDYEEISDEMYEQDNSPRYTEIESIEIWKDE